MSYITFAIKLDFSLGILLVFALLFWASKTSKWANEYLVSQGLSDLPLWVKFCISFTLIGITLILIALISLMGHSYLFKFLFRDIFISID